MQRGFGDAMDPEEMSDDELYEVLMEEFRESDQLDAGWIEVSVQDGFVSLSGRVGTDGEVQVAEQIVHDVVGVQRYANNLVVDELHRGTEPEAADLAAADQQEMGEPLGTPDPHQTDTAAHLASDLEADTYGTRDAQEAIEEGTPYIPPDGPIPEGYRSGENH